MDSFFGIGAAEIVIILIIAGIVLGPHRIRDVARVLGRLTAQMQGISRQFARQLNAELDGIEQSGGGDALAEMRELQRQIQELRQEITAAPGALLADSRKSLQDGLSPLQESRRELERTLKPRQEDSSGEQALENSIASPELISKQVANSVSPDQKQKNNGEMQESVTSGDDLAPSDSEDAAYSDGKSGVLPSTPAPRFIDVAQPLPQRLEVADDPE